ncbi:MAG: hypothetical protein QG626_343 [Patescibacteria group bacterium]|nr:hypothetical protein [Patescibacteria group bacterium]
MCVAVRRCSHREEGSQPKLRSEDQVAVAVAVQLLPAETAVRRGLEELARRPREHGLDAGLADLVVGGGLLLRLGRGGVHGGGQFASLTGEKDSCLAVKV